MTAACPTSSEPAPRPRLPSGFTLHHVGSIGSTNDEASRLARTGAPAGTIVMADRQTTGRGRMGRHWISPVGNLYASIILRPDCPPGASAGLSLLTAVALGEALESLGPEDLDLALKWPNDLLIGGAKVAGILLENTGAGGGTASFLVIGTGVNIRSAPGSVDYPTTSLDAAGFPSLSAFDLLAAYVERQEIWLDRWQRDGFPVVREAWRKRAFNLGGPIRLRLEREEIGGVFVDLTEGGSLLIKQADGRLREISAGDVMTPER